MPGLRQGSATRTFATAWGCSLPALWASALVRPARTGRSHDARTPSRPGADRADEDTDSRLVNEIAAFAESDMNTQDFYGEMLPRVVSALAAFGGAVWALEDQDRIALQCQVNFPESLLAEKDDEKQGRHIGLIQQVFGGGEGLLAPPHGGAGEEGEAANPTDFLLVLGPLRSGHEIVGVVEIFQRPHTGVATQQGYLRFLLQICHIASDFLTRKKLALAFRVVRDDGGGGSALIATDKMEPERIDPKTRWPTRLRSSLLILSLGALVVAAYVVGMATMRNRAVDAERQIDVLIEAFGEDAVDAAQAKDAIIDLVRTKQVDFCWTRATADEMAQLPLTRGDEGYYNFGPFHINLRERTYNAQLGPADEPYIYSGSFVVEGHGWKALPPKLTRQGIKRDKRDNSDSSANTGRPQTPASQDPTSRGD